MMNTERNREDAKKAALCAKLIGLRKACQMTREKNPDPGQSGQIDQIQNDASETLELYSLTRKWEMTNLVSQALDRLKDETFGRCADCEESISSKRLAAVPWARYCMSCQESREDLAPDIRWESAA
jgi:DnaK suppressor protein